MNNQKSWKGLSEARIKLKGAGVNDEFVWYSVNNADSTSMTPTIYAMLTVEKRLREQFPKWRAL
jgi:hypothetical protein